MREHPVVDLVLLIVSLVDAVERTCLFPVGRLIDVARLPRIAALGVFVHADNVVSIASQKDEFPQEEHANVQNHVYQECVDVVGTCQFSRSMRLMDSSNIVVFWYAYCSRETMKVITCGRYNDEGPDGVRWSESSDVGK